MNIHEHQSKELLKNYGVPIPNGIVIFNTEDIKEKIKKINNTNLIIKAQIHAGGRGKGGRGSPGLRLGPSVVAV